MYLNLSQFYCIHLFLRKNNNTLTGFVENTESELIKFKNEEGDLYSDRILLRTKRRYNPLMIHS